MKKLSIIALEKKLGKKLRRKLTILGIDTASNAGMAYLKVGTKIIEFKTEVLRFGTHKKGTPINSKLNTGIEAIENYIDNNNYIDKVIIENAYLGVNKYTYGLLRLIAGIFYTEFSKFTKDIDFYYATEARKIVGFNSKKKSGKVLKKLIIQWIEHLGFGKLKEDEADAVLLALSGLIIQPPTQKALLKTKKKKTT